MTPTERRLRALEAALSVGDLQRVPEIIVQPGETVEAVLAREGVRPVERQRRGWPTLIVRQIVDVPQKPSDISGLCESGDPLPPDRDSMA